MTPIATSFVINNRWEKSWLRASCHSFRESSKALIAWGDSSAAIEARRVNVDNERMKSFDRQMYALAIMFIIVIIWRIAAELRRSK
jgi:hypothetical protein